MPHGQLWPAHPKPLPDELLSSWMVRVAEANAIKLQTMSRLLYGTERTPWNRDIDRFAPKWLLSEICRHTGVTYWAAFHTTLATYRNLLYSRRRLSGQLTWVLVNMNYGTSQRGFGMQFCPMCLAEDAVPYFRKQWRLALYTYCPIHQGMLLDACPTCGASVSYFRRDFGRDLKDALDIQHCHSCGFDLRHSKFHSPRMPDDDVHRRFDTILYSLANTQRISYSNQYGFFAVLHQLCRIMCMRENDGRLLTFVLSQLNCSDEIVQHTSRPIECLRIDERHTLLIAALWLLEDPSPRLKLAWEKKTVRYTNFVKDFSSTPLWYSQVVDPFRAKSHKV